MNSFLFRSYFSGYLLALLVLASTGCKKKEETKPVTVPELGPTTPVTSILETSASSGGFLISDGGSSIIARGVCYGTSPNPTLNSGLPNSGATTDGTGSGSFTSLMNGLQPGTKYYVRAYAANSQGVGYGTELNFSTEAGAPTVTTGAVTNVGLYQNTPFYEANLSGTISSLNGGTVLKKGFVWSTTSTSPTLSNKEGIREDDLAIETGNFTLSMFDAPRLKTVYVRAFVTSQAGSQQKTGYGNTVSFETFVKDIDNNLYNFSKIGTQVWMVENLRVNKLNDASFSIPVMNSSSEWVQRNSEDWIICDYANNSSSTEQKYGLLYNYNTVGTGKVCPVGWHVPSVTEFNTLTNFIGGASGNATKLKSTSDWATGNGTNSSGFNAYPTGYISTGGGASGFGNLTQLHTSTPAGTTNTNIFELNSTNDARIVSYNKAEGSAIRCLKN